MGRTKGGTNTKIHAVVDEAANPIRLFITPGCDADVIHAETLVAAMPGQELVADKGYDSDAFREHLHARAVRACIPPRSNRKHPQPYSRASYRKRHLVENFFERVKNFRRVATRYDKLAVTFLGFVCLAASIILLKSGFTNKP